MEMDHHPRTLQGDDVVSVKTGQNFLINHKTFKANEFLAAMQRSLAGRNEQWFAEGVESEILTPGNNWRRGKVRIRLEFCPEVPIADEQVSDDVKTDEEDHEKSGFPLDEIRLSMQEDT